jgi:unsaturated rhamnogalacturonyl hydrolase
MTYLSYLSFPLRSRPRKASSPRLPAPSASASAPTAIGGRRLARRNLPIIGLVLYAIGAAAHSYAAPPVPAAKLEELLTPPNANLRSGSWGVTRNGTPLRFWQEAADLDTHSAQYRILLVGGLDGSLESVESVRVAMQWFHGLTPTMPLRKKFSLSAIACVNPDGLTSGQSPLNASQGDPSRGYPPTGPAYHSATHPEAFYLWRWIGMLAPDLVVEVRRGNQLRWHTPRAASNEQAPSWLAAPVQALASQAPVVGELPQDSLFEALPKHSPADVGAIAAIATEVTRETTDVRAASRWIGALFDGLHQRPSLAASPAHAEMRRRDQRSAAEIAVELARHYGHTLPNVEYIPAVAMIGRARLAGATADQKVLPDLERIVEPYFSGAKSSTPKSGSGQSGHLIFVELADRTQAERRQRYVELVRVAANQMFDESGRQLQAMPFHAEMSDAVFMGGPILASAGRLTGESRYFDACVEHTRFMQKLVLRHDGIYRHSPLDESAWGRGNGFPALGLALILTELPADHAARLELLSAHRAHLTALLKHQDATGCWHQVIDHPESYRELTATAMITFAMLRGLRLGWLDAKTFQPAAERGWKAVRSRVGREGRLVDVCTGTGKQKSLREYYDREALLGLDPRGGAMALLVATEFMDWEGANREALNLSSSSFFPLTAPSINTRVVDLGRNPRRLDQDR